MGVLLNGELISAPRVQQTLSDRASISGRFTPGEIHRLERDLKGGGLSFSPPLGDEHQSRAGGSERFRGVVATGVALLCVMAIMVAAYRLSGALAACALFLNLLIIAAVMQHLQAVITLMA